MPGYDRFDRVRREMGDAVIRGDMSVTWDPSGKAFYYTKGGKTYAYDIASRKATESKPPEVRVTQVTANRGRPERGRQFASETSPDGKMKAFQRKRNVYLANADGTNEIAVTTEGSVEKRIKYGVASWVYGEELDVRDAIWWSPDSTKIAYYRFDESKVKDYYLAMDILDTQDKLDVEAYPKAGADNPIVDLYVYDLATKQSKRMDVRFDGGNGADIGTYVYEVRWSPDGKELLFNRTNRKQNTMEFCAANPSTGECRVIIRETSPTWTDNSPSIVYVNEDRPGPKRFFWRSERSGFYNWYLYDLTGKLYNAVTKNQFEAERIVRQEAAKGVLFYLARDGEDPYLVQLHRARMDGTDDRRLTDPKFSHTVSVSPDGNSFVDTAETLSEPPTTRLIGLDGKVIETLAQSDLTKFNQLGLKRAERFKFTAADGKTTCYGVLYKPTNFDPSKKYPVAISVYGGPDSSGLGYGGATRFALAPSYVELGFLSAVIDNRGTTGRGRAFKDAVYGKLGIVEIDDQAAGAKSLAERPYVDASRIGIYGTSYGGYASAMAILRHPEVFRVAIACSPVTDWRNYDTIYTERYMGLPWESENKKGYDAGSAMTYADQLKGNLYLYYGTADNNVHPTNTFQLVQALQDAGKSFELMVGPDQGHSEMGFAKILEYFMDKLVLAR